ncbi:MAG: hypothetical protein IAF94_27030 [Pirellulaceae bacterium]|nr:hypothetical protein [Pirellulaceae bacterium]
MTREEIDRKLAEMQAIIERLAEQRARSEWWQRGNEPPEWEPDISEWSPEAG